MRSIFIRSVTYLFLEQSGKMLRVLKTEIIGDFIIRKLTRYVNGKRGAELSIAALVSIANLCTANNTIAIM